jgi:hypothetical protein
MGSEDGEHNLDIWRDIEAGDIPHSQTKERSLFHRRFRGGICLSRGKARFIAIAVYPNCVRIIVDYEWTRHASGLMERLLKEMERGVNLNSNLHRSFCLAITRP